jgi:Ca2+-dependent lipid-binding protein
LFFRQLADVPAKSCVKLNNIDAARHKLDRLYEEMRVDEYASLDVNKPVVVTTNQTSLFTIKIVLGEGLIAEGSTRAPDTFVVLSDKDGNRYAKTRTIYDDHDPRWDETFDIAVKQSAWFMVTVRHRSLTGKHELLGRAYLRLDPSQFVDLISKDVLLPLNTKGHVLLRISMEGERDDIQFHFGRAFRWLKRTESDMVRMFVDKVRFARPGEF